MGREIENEIRQELASKAAWFEWLKQRVDAIHDKVTAHDVLRNGGVELSSNDGVEQFRCPFHGHDNKPSARVYPEDARTRSHAWCFVCQERWDILALWRKFNAADEMPFSSVVASIEREYGLTPPEMPKEATIRAPKSNHALEAFEKLYTACENRLRSSRDSYQRLGDMRGFLSAGAVLDKLYHKVGDGAMTPGQGEEVLRKLLDRIGAKVRSVPPEELMCV